MKKQKTFIIYHIPHCHNISIENGPYDTFMRKDIRPFLNTKKTLYKIQENQCQQSTEITIKSRNKLS